MEIPIFYASENVTIVGATDSNLFVKNDIIVKVSGAETTEVDFIFYGNNGYQNIKVMTYNYSAELNIRDVVKHVVGSNGSVLVRIDAGATLLFERTFIVSDKMYNNVRSAINPALPAPNKVYTIADYNPFVNSPVVVSRDACNEGGITTGFCTNIRYQNGTVIFLDVQKDEEYSVSLEQIQCGQAYAAVSYADSLLNGDRVEFWKVDNISNIVSDTLELSTLNSMHNVLKSQRIEISMYIDGLDLYSAAYYSEIINANKVKLKFGSIGQEFTDYDDATITSKNVTMSGGNNNRVEVKAIILQTKL